MNKVKSQKSKRIVFYGLDRGYKQCSFCHRRNNSKNTHCWYCKGSFKSQKSKNAKGSREEDVSGHLGLCQSSTSQDSCSDKYISERCYKVISYTICFLVLGTMLLLYLLWCIR